MKAVIYVEGPSDVAAMQTLLKPLISRKLDEGISIEFYETPDGDRKKSVLEKAPKKAANTILNEPDTVVALMPDLYPRDKGFPHTTYDELSAGVIDRFKAEIALRTSDPSPDVFGRFHVFCFKYDLEALLLAAEGPLLAHLGLKKFPVQWKHPVEDQNHKRPPKQVVDELFKKAKRRYKETADAAAILLKADYNQIAEACPQCFKPFVEFLEGLGAV